MQPKLTHPSVWKDIRIWIVIFFLVRLTGITNPPLETGHNWRQSLTNMIARNFVEQKTNLFYPEIDYAGSASGIIGSEFPFFNFLIYLVSLLFDYSHWYGRLINLIVSSLGIYFFHRLVSKLVNPGVAFPATIILLSSIWFAFSRKIMPDTFSVSLVIIGLYAGYQYLMAGRRVMLFLFFLLSTLGVLSKIPSVYLFASFGVLIFTKQIPVHRRLTMGLAAGVSFMIVSLWYFWWVPHLVATYQNKLFFPRGFIVGLKEIAGMADAFFRNFYFNAFHSYTAMAAFLTGLYFVAVGKNTLLTWGLSLVTAVFLLFTVKTGIVFPLHNYYIIPFVPVMAMVAGIALEKLKAKYMYVILLIIVAEGIGNQQHDFFIREKEGYKLAVEELVEANTGRQDLIVINGGQSPQEIYFAHRKGWSVTNDKLTLEMLARYRQAGAAWLIVNHRTYPDSLGFLQPTAIGKDYALYSLQGLE